MLRVGEIYEGQRQFPLAIVLPEKYRTEIEAVRNLVIPTATGIHVPLSEVAEIVEAPGAATINREWGCRLIRVQTNVDGRDVVSFVEEAKRKIAEEIDLPEGYVIEWGGQFENLERAHTRLSIVVPLTMIIGACRVSVWGTVAMGINALVGKFFGVSARAFGLRSSSFRNTDFHEVRIKHRARFHQKPRSLEEFPLTGFENDLLRTKCGSI